MIRKHRVCASLQSAEGHCTVNFRAVTTLPSSHTQLLQQTRVFLRQSGPEESSSLCIGTCQTFQIKVVQLCVPGCVTPTAAAQSVDTPRRGEMSGITLLSLSVAFLSFGGAMILPEEPDEPALSLNDMFREVEELMEDTQHILEEAVDQITTESAKSNSLEHRLSHQNGTDRSTLDKTIKNFSNHRDSHIHMDLTSQWNSNDQECMVDEDCGELKYCLYEIDNSKCLPCIPTDMPCTKDEECCSDQMCVWGQCTENATRGEEGTICQDQRDCKPLLCCAFQRELLFPVCNPRPERGELCVNQPNLLMDMLAWDREGPRDHCPCAQSLQCQPHGRGAVCRD
ncbi:hypothetical protein WMY93_024009 [Mugilogobius chulae]|uniref:Dickkopf N-terminal cysteine-rich domain-containing protein n=1 Tax=Mugilogobius chulae TaxID=88201 RepID=A0AAW0N700_9GOBI